MKTNRAEATAGGNSGLYGGLDDGPKTAWIWGIAGNLDEFSFMFLVMFFLCVFLLWCLFSSFPAVVIPWGIKFLFSMFFFSPKASDANLRFWFFKM